MKYAALIVMIVFSLQASSYAVSAVPTVDEVLSYTPDRQFEYLSKPELSLSAYYKNNREEYVQLLLGIAAQKNAASEMAMYAFNMYVLKSIAVANYHAESPRH